MPLNKIKFKLKTRVWNGENLSSGVEFPEGILIVPGKVRLRLIVKLNSIEPE